MAGTRNEQASAARLRRARQAGLQPDLLDLRLAAWALGLLLWTRYLAADALSRLQTLLRTGLSGADAEPLSALTEGAVALTHMLAPALLLFALLASLPALLHGQIALRGGRLWRNPFSSLRAESTFLRLGLGSLRLILFGLLSLQVWAPLSKGLRSLGLHRDLATLVDGLAQGGLALSYRVLVAVLVVAPVGLWAARLVHRRGLRMTREERLREQLREELHPRMASELKKRTRAENPGPAGLADATHALCAEGVAIVLAIARDAEPRFLRLLRGVQVTAAEQQFPALVWLKGSDPELRRRLALLSPGDSVPRACYPALAQLVAAQRDKAATQSS